MRVAYLGPEGTFTPLLPLKHFGHACVAVQMTAVDEVFREVAAGAVHYGVVPVENSTEGVVNHTLDNFMDSSVKICGEEDSKLRTLIITCWFQDVTTTDNIQSHLFSRTVVRSMPRVA